jgi:zinc transport system substrate-binding protein
MGQGRTSAGHIVSRTGICRRAMGLSLLLLSVITAGTGARARGGDLKVVATIKPVHSLVSQVMAGLGRPVLLVDGQASPHSFSMKPSDARALADAEVVVRVAASVEPFTVRLAETLGAGTQLVTLAEAPGVELLETRRGTTFEVHDHATEAHGQPDGHDEHKNAAHKHDGAVKAQGPDHEYHALDGHIWLDPGNAKAIVRNVADVLAERRPDLKEKLDANAATAIAAIDALDKELMATLAAVKEKRFIVFHDAYQYFEHYYGLQAAGAITLNPEVKPSARRLSEIRETLSKSGAACVFAEPQFSPRIVAAVIEGTKAKAGTLDPLGVDVPAGSDHYAGAMRALAKAMTGCLVG